MAVDFVVRSETVPAGSVGSVSSARLNKRQELVMMPWEFSLGVEGRLFIANRGVLTTPVAQTNITLTTLRPDMAVRVPSGTTIIPLRMEVYWEVTGAGVTEIMANVSSNDVGAGTSTAVTPVSLSPNSGRGTACIVARDYTADCAALTSGTEFYRDGYPTDPDVAGNPAVRFVWSYLLHGAVPVLRGPASLMLATNNATSGSYFASISWAEFLTSELV